MKERPILFSAPMVRALLAGTKTQTRRVVKPLTADRINHCPGHLEELRHVSGPYGQPGDRLWVREAFNDDRAETIYRADGGMPGDWRDAGSRWRPSIHMPRWASRITLEVTDVRVERLQNISEADAIAEGIERGQGFPGWYRGPLSGDSAGLQRAGRDFKIPTAFPKLAYRALWESINGPESWEANPWVWAVTFKRVQP